MLITAQELCHLLGGELEGDPNAQIHAPSRIEEAGKGTLTFLANPKYEQYVYSTQASVVLVSRDFSPESPVNATLIRVDDVYGSIGQLLQHFNHHEAPFTGVSEQSMIAPDVKVPESTSVGAFTVIARGAEIGPDCRIYPQVFIGDNVKIGKRVTLYPGVRIYHGCVIGDDCILHSNAVIGSDGFGFSKDQEGNYQKVPQIGNVLLENGVEVGANSAIDRATMGSTIIRSGTKLDNLIQIAHNVEIGRNTAIAAQVGIAGSTKVGENVIIGGQAGLVGHIRIADGSQIQAQSGVANTFDKPDSRIYGYPALEYMHYLKSYAVFKQLPDLQKKVKMLEQELRNMGKTPNEPED